MHRDQPRPVSALLPPEAVEVHPGRPDASLVLTCEHASAAIPHPWSLPETDNWLLATHWAWDLGAADLTRALAAAVELPAVLARFSRLLIDANRDLGSDTLLLPRAEGRAIAVNERVDIDELERRIAWLYRPYHEAVSAVVTEHPRAGVLSIHSFTPSYEGGPPRPMEIGVLFDRDVEVAEMVAQSLGEDGWAVALNEPYSGADGLMFAAHHHASAQSRVALELEVRQDLCDDPGRRPALVASVTTALSRAGLIRV